MVISSSGAVRANRRLPVGKYSQKSPVTDHRDPLQVHISWPCSSPAWELNAALSPRGIGGSCLTLGICLRAAGIAERRVAAGHGSSVDAAKNIYSCGESSARNNPCFIAGWEHTHTPKSHKHRLVWAGRDLKPHGSCWLG